jgi:hypothetical protein
MHFAYQIIKHDVGLLPVELRKLSSLVVKILMVLLSMSSDMN